MHIGERLKEERKRLGYKTQDDAAQLCNITREQWGKYERGLLVPSGEVLLALASKSFDVHYILTGAAFQRSVVPQEAQLLSIWHSSTPALQKEALAVLLGVQKPKKFDQTFKGSVGSVVEAESISGGDFRVKMKDGKPKGRVEP